MRVGTKCTQIAYIEKQKMYEVRDIVVPRSKGQITSGIRGRRRREDSRERVTTGSTIYFQYEFQIRSITRLRHHVSVQAPSHRGKCVMHDPGLYFMIRCEGRCAVLRTMWNRLSRRRKIKMIIFNADLLLIVYDEIIVVYVIIVVDCGIRWFSLNLFDQILKRN